MQFVTQKIDHHAHFDPRKPKRVLRPHHTRDETAFMELMAAFHRRGFEYGELILNYPPIEKPGKGGPKDLYKIDTSRLDSSHLIVQTTRPPMDDEEQGRIRVERGWTDLEALIFEKLRPYFDVCARSHMKLARTFRARLPAGFEKRADIVFFQHQRAWYQKWKVHSNDRFKLVPQEFARSTAAFLVRLGPLWDDGPGFLTAFGMGGTETLVWAHRLRNDFTHLLDGYGLSMVEMTAPPEAHVRPTSLDFANDWKIEPILTHETL